MVQTEAFEQEGEKYCAGGDLRKVQGIECLSAY